MEQNFSSALSVEAAIVGMNRLMLVSSLFVVTACGVVFAQDWMAPVGTPKTEMLWPNGAPGAQGTTDADDIPALTIYLPAKPQATGAGIVICPGGGYGALAMDHEGHEVARWLTSRGVAASASPVWRPKSGCQHLRWSAAALSASPASARFAQMRYPLRARPRALLLEPVASSWPPNERLSCYRAPII